MGSCCKDGEIAAEMKITRSQVVDPLSQLPALTVLTDQRFMSSHQSGLVKELGSQGRRLIGS